MGSWLEKFRSTIRMACWSTEPATASTRGSENEIAPMALAWDWRCCSLVWKSESPLTTDFATSLVVGGSDSTCPTSPARSSSRPCPPPSNTLHAYGPSDSLLGTKREIKKQIPVDHCLGFTNRTLNVFLPLHKHGLKKFYNMGRTSFGTVAGQQVHEFIISAFIHSAIASGHGNQKDLEHLMSYIMVFQTRYWYDTETSTV